MIHEKLDGLMTPMEKMARVSMAGLAAATSPQTAPSGAISLDNADGTRTIIGEVSNGEDNPSYTMATHVGDTTPPGIPTGITATSRSGVVVVEWDGTLAGGIPDDFFCIRIYLDGEELGALSEAGSVASATLESGTTHSVTATSEDDCCLPDGTPAHNVSEPTTAITVTVDDDVAAVAEAVEEAREIADAAKSEADAHAAIIPVIQQDIADFKDEVEADYYTKTDVDEVTGAITSEMRASYRDSIARNLSPFYAHDFQDVYNATSNPDGYWTETPANATQLTDGWAHITLPNASGTGTMYSRTYVRPMASVPDNATLLIEVENLVTNVTSTTTKPRLWFNPNMSSSQMGGAIPYLMEDGVYRVALTKNSNLSPTHFARWWWGIENGGTAEFDARISVYEGTYDGPFKPYVTQQDELGRTYVETAKYTVDQTGVTARLDANYQAIETVSGDLEDYKDANDAAVAAIQSQVDGQIEAWYYSVEPTLQNEPAVNWTTEELRERHRGDIYYDITTGHSWRWMKDGSTWQWQAIPDSDAAAALAEAQAALAKAGEKRRIFTSTPVAPYDVNDLWLRSFTETIEVGGEQQTSTGPEIWYSTQLRTGDGTPNGSYHESDWQRWIRRTVDYSQYANYEFQTDHALSQLGDSLETTQGDVTAVTERVSTVEQDAASWKAEVKRTYATKSSTQPNLSPFFAHDLTDIYNATDNPDGYFWNDQASSPELGVVGTQLSDGWMHYELDNSARTNYACVYPYQRPIASLKPSTGYTLLIELRNMVTDAPYSSSFRITSQHDDATRISQTVNPNGYDDIYLARGGTFCKALATKPDMSAATLFCRQYIALAAGLKASFDLRLSLYETVSPELLLDTNAPTLTKVDGPFDRYLSDASNTQVEMTYGAISDPPEELGSDARYGFIADYDGSYNGYRGRSLAFYSGSTSGDARPTFMQGGKQYQATWWARVVSGTAYGRAYFINNGTNNAKQPTGDTALPYTSEWRRYTVSIRPVNPSYARAYFTAAFAANKAGKVELCGFSLQEMDATFKPYVTGQDDLSKTYATNASLTLTDSRIRSDVASTYQSKADMSSYYTKTEVEQRDDAITSTVMSRVDGIQALGENLLNDVVNPYLVTSLGRNGWQVASGGNGTGSVEDVTDSPQTGVTKSLRITGNTSGHRDFGQFVPLVGGETYTFTAWVRSLSGTVNALLRMWDSKAEASKTISVGAEWQRISVSMTPTAAASNIRMLMGINGAGGIEYLAPVLVQANTSYVMQSTFEQTTEGMDGRITTARAMAGWYGTCSTAAATAAKVVTVVGLTELVDGTQITIRCSTASTTSVPTINVNGLGAKAVWHAGAVTATSNELRWGTGAEITLLYDGTKFTTVGQPKSYATSCSTAAATAAKAATATGFVLCKGATVALQMTNANTANNTTLNVSATGGYEIYLNGARQTTANAADTTWAAGGNVTFCFDGRYWRMGEGSAIAKANAEATLRETLIRQYSGGVLAGYVGNTLAALVNAAGSFDVVSTTWSGGEPTVTGTLASFASNLIELGKSNVSAIIEFCADKLHMAFSGNTGRIASEDGVRMTAGTYDLYASTQASVMVHTKADYEDESGTYQLGDGTDKNRIVLASDTVVMLPTGYSMDYGTKGFSTLDLVRFLPQLRLETYGAWVGTTFDPTEHQLVMLTGTAVQSTVEMTISYGMTFVGVKTVICAGGDDTGLGGSQLVVADSVTTTGFKPRKLNGSAGLWRCNWMAIGWVNAAQG